MIRRPPRSPLFPYTTLSRSVGERQPLFARQENRQRVKRKQPPQTAVEHTQGLVQTGRVADFLKQFVKRSRGAVVAHNNRIGPYKGSVSAANRSVGGR